jgi:VCBS repeat-containing protein
VFVKNNQFTGGQDERDFQTVSKSDINSIATLLKTAVAQSMQGALQGQAEPNEQLYILPNRPTVTSDHQIGQEATQVNVTVSQTCSAVAYNSQELATKVTAFLSTQAQQHIGTGYSLFGTVHVSFQAATVTRSSTVLLSFSASGTWVYGLSQPAQQRIKQLIAGKTTQEALQLLAALPGVEQAAIRFEGFGNDTRLPKQSSLIHLAFVVI